VFDAGHLAPLWLLVGLIGAAVAVAIVTRRSALPSTVALVLFGLAVSVAGPAVALPIDPELLLAIVLPGLVFEAAFRTDVAVLRRSVGGILLLAIPGVVIVATIVALVLSATTALTFTQAFLVGSMVAATDPAAVLAIFRHVRVPVRLATIVEMESLVNDGTGIVLFALALEMLQGGGSLGGAALAFGLSVGGSAVLGGLLGAAAARVVRGVDEHLTELALTVVLAYGTYLAADVVGLSGVIATLVAAGTFGARARGRLTPRTIETIDVVWEFVAFLLTAAVFLLVGLAIAPATLARAAIPIAWGIVAILVARAVVVYGLLGAGSALAARAGRGAGGAVPRSWLHVLFWAGLRGAVSVALALSIPAGLPNRDLIQGITFGVVLFTLVVQGTTARAIVERSGAGRDGDPDPGASAPSPSSDRIASPPAPPA
jgi:CPA1 family monovalent cation:H+ antiporter